ncbi:MAG: chloride channel protein [Thermodesulfobacterium sp.]|nr:chloride channel protein [Thermodesulfobacterium sp.]
MFKLKTKNYKNNFRAKKFSLNRFILLKKNYILFAFLTGLGAGIFAILFMYLLNLINHLVLENIVGYIQPRPAGEGGISKTYTLFFKKPYLLPLTVGLGGLISGILVYLFSPESAGVGTDSAINAYHNQKKLSIKSSIVKLITSAITIGTGGVSGREGPIALIGAGIGSTVANFFKLGERERRLFLAVGLGAGIAAIFKAPLAGAIISGEVFFKKDFDIEATVLSFIASITSYTVYCLFFGFQPIFLTNIPTYIKVSHLLFYIGLGIFCALITRVYVFFFHKVTEVFNNLKLPLYFKPLLGGLLAGTIGAFIPMAIGNGYGWLQLIMDGKTIDPYFIALGTIGVIWGVSFTLGSGGSGGVFGPSVMIGGLAGALFSILLNTFFNLNLNITSFMIVGMVSLFGSAAKAPLSTLILVAEMTGGYSLLLPAMLSVFTAYFLSGKRSIFPSQVDTKFDSPAYRNEYGVYILERLRIKDYMKNPITIDPEASLEEAFNLMKKKFIGGLPVVKNGELIGIITKTDLSGFSPTERKHKKVQEVMNKNLITVTALDTLAHALELMINNGIGRLPVVEKENKKNLIGIIARADIGKALREQLNQSL